MPLMRDLANIVKNGHRDPYKERDSNGVDEDASWFMKYLMKIPFMNDTIRNHFVACSGEFVGTVLFLYFSLGGTQVANNIPSSSGDTVAEIGSNPQQLQYIALCFGFSLAVNAWVFFRISGGLFNPAVTIGMVLIGALPKVRGLLLFFTQIVGGIVAAALISAMLPGPLNVQTTLGGGTTIVQGLFIEMILTAQLVFTIIMLAAEKHKSTFIAPVGIGLSLFIAELLGVYFTGGSLNPARSFGPALIGGEWPGYHWIYWVGPILGSLLAAAFYKFIKALEFETANPGQDGADIVDQPVVIRENGNSSEENLEKGYVDQDDSTDNNDISMGGGQSGATVTRNNVNDISMGGGSDGAKVEKTNPKDISMGGGADDAAPAQKTRPQDITMGGGGQQDRPPAGRGASYMA